MPQIQADDPVEMGVLNAFEKLRPYLNYQTIGEEETIFKILKRLTSVLVCNALFCDTSYPHEHDSEPWL